MRVTPTLTRLLLLACLILPALALLPPTQHGFDVPKSLAWETLVALAAAAAAAWTPGVPSRPGGGLSRALGALWILWVAALALLLATGTLHRRVFGMVLELPPYRTEFTRALALLLGLQMLDWARRRARTGSEGTLVWMALGLASLWCFSAAASFRPDAAFPALLDWLAYPLLLFAVWRSASGARERGRLASAVLAVGAISAAYGLAQSFGLDAVPWAEHFDGRASGFFGNPNFLGGYLALCLPLSLTLCLMPGQAWPGKLARWALAGLLAAGLVASQTRGAWIAALLGCAVSLAALARREGLLRANRSALLLAGGLLALGLSGWWILGAGPQARARIQGIASGDQEFSRRAFLMAKTARLALRHPLLGVGPGNYRIFFPSVEVQGMDPADYARQPFVITEHAHNDFLQMAADAGWPAALLWAALTLLVLARLARGLDRVEGADLALVSGVLGCLSALAVHGLANFPFQQLPTQAAAWALAALALRPLGAEGPVELPSPSLSRRLALLGAGVAVVLLMMRARQLTEDGLWWIGSGELAMHHAVQASPILLSATAYDRDEDRIWSLHGQSHYERGDNWEAIGSFREAHRLNPYDAEVAVRLGVVLVDNKLFPEAYEVLSSAALYAPNLPDLWEPLAAACFQTRKYEDAVKAYDWMLYYHIHEDAAYSNKAAALGNLGRLPEALETLRQAEIALPQSGKIQLNLAITYYKMNLRRLAHEAWKKASVLSPSDPQVDSLREAMRP